MRITIAALNFAPEVTGIAPYTTAIAEGLSVRGHDVEVLAGLPHYPGWQELPGYRGRAVESRSDSLRVRRVDHYVPNGHSLRGRLRMEMSFGRSAAARSWSSPDVLLMMSPPLFAAGALIAAARLRAVPTVVAVQDLYGKGANETAALASAAGALTWIESRVLRAASRVVVIHDRFADSVGAMGVPANRIETIRNWTHVPDIGDVNVAEVRAELGWKQHEVVALHAGNMGMKQGLENVVEAAALAERGGLPLRFSLVGGGNQRAHLIAAATGLRSIEFRETLPSREFLRALRAADVLLVNERSGVADMAVPSKLTSYFASGRPIVAATDRGSVTQAEVRAAGAGVTVPADDPRALVDACLQLAADPGRGRAFGAAARAFATGHLNESRAIDDYERVCRSALTHRRGADV